MNVTTITKGQIITSTGTGRRYTVLSTRPWAMNTHNGDQDANYAIMVRPMHVGRAFDLTVSQGMLDRGAYTVAAQ